MDEKSKISDKSKNGKVNFVEKGYGIEDGI